MRADEIQTILTSAVGAPVVVVPASAPTTWIAWFAGTDAEAQRHRERVRSVAPRLAGLVSWVAIDQLVDPAVLADRARNLAPPQPETALEHIVAVAWHEALGSAATGIDEDFFETGGHSLLAAEVVARLCEVTGRDIPLTVVLDFPTIREQAAWIAEHHATSRALARHPRVIVSKYSLVGTVERAALERAVAQTSERFGHASTLVDHDLRGLRDFEPSFDEAACRLALAGGGAKGLLVAAFDGRRFDRVSARAWIEDLAEAYRANVEHRAAIASTRTSVSIDDLVEDAPTTVGWRGIGISSSRMRAVLEVGRQQAATPHATLLAVVAISVARRTGRTEVVLDVPASLRIGAHEHAAFGPLTAMTPVSISFAGSPSFCAVIERASASLSKSWAAAAGLVERENAVADASVVVSAVAPRIDAGTVSLHDATPKVSSTAPFAFVLRRAASGRFAGWIGFDGLGTSADDAEQMSADFDALLAELAATPTRPLDGVVSTSAEPVASSSERSDPLPLTHAQEQLWFLEALQPGTTANHIQRVYRLDGALDNGALVRALEAMQQRHEGLRTVFSSVDGSPRQFVLRSLPLEHVVEELAADRIGERSRTELAKQFDLANGPLWRTRLCRLSETDHRLIFTIHHLVVDALSVLVWIRELVEHYHADLAHAAPRLPRVGEPATAIAMWERSPEGQQRISEDLAFWRDELAGATPLDLPIDFHRPSTVAVERHEAEQLLSSEQAANIRALGRRHGATLNVTLIAAAYALLSLHTGREDIVCIVPAARRDDPGRKSVIGLLLNLLPLRVKLDGDPTFGEIVARTNRAMQRALAHSDAPFERIVAGLGLARDPGRQPLFDVIINMVPGAERTRSGSVRFTLEHLTNSAQPCDLIVSATTKPGGFLALAIRCREDLFASASAERISRRFRTLLLAAASAPNTPLSALPLLPPDERTTLLETWNDTAMSLPDVTVHGLVAEQTRRTPDAIAIVQGDRTLTYRELDARACALARRLRDAGIAPGTPVGVVVRPSPELAIAALGVLAAGAIYVPLDASQPAARLALLVSEVAAVIVETQDRPFALPTFEVTTDGDAPVATTLPEVSPDANAYVVFTSGSTGRPKGVATTHRALVNQIAWFSRDLPWQPHEVSSMRSSPAFVDSLWELFGPLAGGVPVMIATTDEMKDPRLLVAALERHRVTRIVVVPSLLQTILELGVELPSLTLWLATSEELKPSLVHAFRARRPTSRLVNLYGASETADQVAAFEISAPDERATRTPIGRPIANSRIYILDPRSRLQPIGAHGEICVGGVGLSNGYLGDVGPEARAKFTQNPHAPGRMYRTGDRGRWRHDGLLEYAGRLDQQLKIRGIRVDPGEVEMAILAHPSIAGAAVTASPGYDGTSRLVAHVVVRGPNPPGPVELRRFLRARLPETLIPTSFVALDALPLGATGKVDRDALPAIAPAAMSTRAPQGVTEHAVALAWEQLLGRAVGAEEDFFEAGGQSLVAAQLGARLAERFGVELPLAVLFERTTIAAQAAWLEDRAREVPHAQIPRAGEVAVPLSFAQERLAFAAALSPRAPMPKLRFALQIDGPLDLARLETAMQRLADRHSSLRTVFTGEGASARQRVAASCPRDHRFEDLRSLSDADQRAAIHRHVDEERERPFDLAVGPPWRTRVLQLGDQSHVLIVAMHHYVSDGISVQLWIDELHQHYVGSPSLPPVVVSAADFAVWQRRMADSSFWDSSRRFWRDTLANHSVVTLPVSTPRSAWSSGRGGSVRDRLGRDEVAALDALARAEQTTLFAVLLGGAGALLHEVTASTDMIVGTIAAGRDRPELRNAIGLFLNPLPLRLDLAGNPTVRELVHRTGATSRAALAHSDVPFEQIVADANPGRRPYRQPLFDVVLNHHPPAPPPRIGDLRVERVRNVGTPLPPYELMIRTILRGAGHDSTGTPDGIAIQFDYQRDRFADDTVANWLARFVALLRHFASDPSHRLSTLTS